MSAGLLAALAETMRHSDAGERLSAEAGRLADVYGLNSDEEQALRRCQERPLDELLPPTGVPRGRVPGPQPFGAAWECGFSVESRPPKPTSQPFDRDEALRLAARSLQALLRVATLECGGEPVNPDGVRWRTGRAPATPFVGGESLQSVRRPTPLIEHIARSLGTLLADFELLRDGEPLSVDGFRLRDVHDWCYPAGSPEGLLRYVVGPCRMACTFCYQRGNPPELRRVKRHATPAELELRLGLGEQGSELFHQTVFDSDEMLTHPRALEVLRRVRARSPEAPLNITTNGCTLDEGMVRELAALRPLVLMVSLNAVDGAVRREVLRDPAPERAVRALPVLREAGIPFVVSMVAWPTVPFSELEATVCYAEANGAQMVRVNLPGHTRCFPGAPPYDREGHWRAVAERVRSLRAKLRLPLFLSPGLYEENTFAEEKNTPRVTGVVPASPAAEGGVRAGDVLLAVNGVAVESRPAAKLVLLLAFRSPECRLLLGRDAHRFGVSLQHPSGERYPYLHVAAARFGVVLPDGLSPAYLSVAAQAARRAGARRVLLLTSLLVRPSLEAMLASRPQLWPRDIELNLAVPEDGYFGGNVVMGDLQTVDDMAACVRAWGVEHGRPDLVLAPSSPFAADGWGRDVRGVPWQEIERRTGVRAALVPCEPMWT